MSAGNVAVVDSWAILAFLRAEEPGATLQLTGEAQAEERLGQVKALPIEIVPARESLVLEAARVKARHPLSYADAFAVATGRLEKAPVLTGDPEILSLPATVVRVRRLDRHA